MYWRNICYFMCNKSFEKNVIEDGSLHIYFHFGTFCVQIGWLFKSQWAFKECLNIDKSLFSKKNVAALIFLLVFKDSLLLKTLSYLDANGVKRSVYV